MTPPRLQEHRHWVQIEYAPNKGKRRVFTIDLNMVDKVTAVFGENPEDPKDENYAVGIRIVYAGVIKPIDLENTNEFTGPSALNFWKTWLDYIELKDKQPAAKVGIIHAVRENSLKL